MIDAGPYIQGPLPPLTYTVHPTRYTVRVLLSPASEWEKNRWAGFESEYAYRIASNATRAIISPRNEGMDFSNPNGDTGGVASAQKGGV